MEKSAKRRMNCAANIEPPRSLGICVAPKQGRGSVVTMHLRSNGTGRTGTYILLTGEAQTGGEMPHVPRLRLNLHVRWKQSSIQAMALQRRNRPAGAPCYPDSREPHFCYACDCSFLGAFARLGASARRRHYSFAARHSQR